MYWVISPERTWPLTGYDILMGNFAKEGCFGRTKTTTDETSFINVNCDLRVGEMIEIWAAADDNCGGDNLKLWTPTGLSYQVSGVVMSRSPTRKSNSRTKFVKHFEYFLCDILMTTLGRYRKWFILLLIVRCFFLPEFTSFFFVSRISLSPTFSPFSIPTSFLFLQA